MAKVDFKRLAGLALSHVETVLARWLPDGRREGVEYVARNPTRSDERAGSFSVNLKTGVWSDFATDDKGGDLISLVAYVDGVSQGDAARSLADFLGADTRQHEQQAAPPAKQSKKKKAAGFNAMLPAPEKALATCPDRHPKLGRPSTWWEYRDRHGRLMLKVARFDRFGGRGKEYRPLCYGTASGREGWHWRQPESDRPLYGLDLLADRPEAAVVLCEGEKATDAARQLFPDRVCLTWPGGSKAIRKVDFSALASREVLYWPDGDKAGADSVPVLAEALRAAGAGGFEVVDVEAFRRWRPAGTPKAPELVEPGEWPDKADAADALDLGWTAAHLAELCRRGHLVRQQPEASGRPDSGQSLPRFRVDAGGLYWLDTKLERWRRLSDWLEVVAQSRTDDGKEWGVLVRFRDRDGREREWNIPFALFASDNGTEVVKKLLSMGLRIEPERYARRPLIEYLMGTDTERRVTLVGKMGWHGGAFMLPDGVIGEPPEPLHFYSDAPPVCRMAAAGSLADWQEHVAAFAIGNDLVAFALSAAFAPPLLDLIGAETCGFHFVGDSSLGKSTLLKVAASVCGGPDEYPRTWRATDNALEATAAAHSDCLLILDEIGQCDPRIIGETVYMLGNGQGKARANDRGAARDIQHRWRLVFLSSGERTLLDHLADVGKKPQAGMEMRLLTVPACFHQDEQDRKTMGIYQDIRNYNGGAALSDHLGREVARAHGTAFPAFLGALLKPEALRKVPGRIQTVRLSFLAECLTDGASGQARRAADKFAMVAAAGELATEWGVTGWPAGEALRAAAACFRAWLHHRGGEGSHEERQIVEHVRYLLELYGESRFTRWDSEEARIDEHAPRTMERWGFRRTIEETSMIDGVATETRYYVLPEAFRNAFAKGHDPKRVAGVLADLGALELDDGRFTKRARLPGMGSSQKRCYIIRAAALYSDAQAASSSPPGGDNGDSKVTGF